MNLNWNSKLVGLAAGLAFGSFVFSAQSFAGGNAPPCLGKNGSEISINDQQVLEWKTSTKNQWLSRAHIQGTLVQVYPDENGHHHYEVQIGSDASNTIEVIYNISFGETPDPKIGMEVEACGDYITSDAATSQYPASPDGAIIHWIHRSNNEAKHASGYLIMGGELCGQGNG